MQSLDAQHSNCHMPVYLSCHRCETAWHEIKKEETDDEYENESYATFEDVYLLAEKTKGKSSTAQEKAFYGHLQKYIMKQGRHMLVSNLNKIQDYIFEFESITQKQAESVDAEEELEFPYTSFLEGIIQESQIRFPE